MSADRLEPLLLHVRIGKAPDAKARFFDDNDRSQL
jgi:hypothetical protein